MSNCKILIFYKIYIKRCRSAARQAPKVTSLFLQQQLVNQLIIYFAPKLIGGSGTNQFFKHKKL